MRDHRLDSGEFYLEAGRYGHLRDCLFASEKDAVLFVIPSKSPGFTVSRCLAEIFPILIQRLVEVASIDKELMPHPLGFALG